MISLYKIYFKHYLLYFNKRRKAKNLLKKILESLNYKINKFKGIIYVIGDSHVNFFGGNEKIDFIPLLNGINTSKNLYPLFKTFHLGPALAYNLSILESQSKALEKTLFLIEQKIIPASSVIMLCFGEIDIRTRVLKQAEKQNKPIEDIIDIILNNYLIYIKMILNKGHKVICWGPIASQKKEWENSPEFPRYGSEIERNKATEIFNIKLELLAKKYNFYFCSVFKYLIDSNYITQNDVIFDGCHLAQKNLDVVLKELINNTIFIIDEEKKLIEVNKDL